MRCVALVLATLSTPVMAEVKSVTAIGFEVTKKVTVKVQPQRAYAGLGQVSKWWNPAHTYSGDAKNLSLTLKAGGCFCEKIPAKKASIEHGRIIFAQPGKTLRFQGGLGPIQPEGAIGTMTWTIKAVPDGTEITQSYVVGGYIRAGADVYAPLVDRVMNEQLERLAAYLNAP
ncbi:MAG: SRPBCC domain-containing protein [Chakrabartia sp.]